MDQVAGVVLPVFGLIGVGYGAARLRILSDEAGDALSEFVFVVAIPLLMLRILATADFAGLSAWRLWAPFFGAFGLSWIAGAMMVRTLFGRGAREGLVAGLASGYGNTTMVGLPAALGAYGAAGAAPMALIIGVQMPIMMTIVAILMERAERLDGSSGDGKSAARLAASVWANLIKNPIVVGMAAGLAWRLTGFPFGGLAGGLVGRLADVASPLALFALGMSIRRYGLRGELGVGAVVSALKLLLMPALVLAIAVAIHLTPLTAKVAVLAAACPTGVTPYLVANRFRTGEGLASNAITLSTALSVLSFALWLAVSGRLLGP